LEPNFFIALVAAIVVGPFMVVAGILKARQRSAFETSLQSYAFVPPNLRRPLSFGIPALEAALGAAVLTLQVPVLAGLATAILLLTFTAATVKAAGWSGSAGCGCFGPAHVSSVRVLLARNAALSVLALIPTIVAFDPSQVVTIAIGGIALLALVVLTLVQSRAATVVPETEPADPGRRRLLRGGVALGATVAASAAGLFRGGGLAEAACAGCGSCADQYIFINCTSPCCAVYYVRRRNNCDGACVGCSGWWTQEFCGIPGCGC
jgi:hypothetical protein